MIAMGVLVYRLYDVQVSEGPEHTERLRKLTTVTVLIPPARGSIVDRNGKALAENRHSVDIDVNLRELVSDYKRRNKGKTPKTKVPGLPHRKMVDVAKIVDETCSELLNSLGLEITYSREDILRHYYQKPNIPFQLVQDLSFKELSEYSELGMHIPGVNERPRPVRVYPYGALAPHIIGYVGDVEVEKKSGLTAESEGKAGIEESMDQYLQGRAGVKYQRKDTGGYILGEELGSSAEVGKTVYLTLDARIQHIVEEAMRPVGRGACVIMDPYTGDILAMVSVPNFDPNSFVPSLDTKTWKRLTRDPTRPLLNRSINVYAPGSIYKTVVAMAAMGSEKSKYQFSPKTKIYSPGAIYIGNRFFKDWYAMGRGTITLHDAMRLSTNTFFYQLGIRSGDAAIKDISNQLGLGSRVIQTDGGLPLLKGEDPGFIPSGEWMRQRGEKKIAAWRKRRQEDPEYREHKPWVERWTDAHTANTSIGQGFVEVSPLQMTTMVSSVVNGGKVYNPRLVQAVVGHGEEGMQVVKDFPPRLRAELDLSEEELTALHASMRAVVTSGTARAANSNKVAVCGKTGTAQFWTNINGKKVKDLRAWFNGFAPDESPRYAITIVVEGGKSGGGTCGPIVKEIFEKITEMEAGHEPELYAMSEAIGHYSGVRRTGDTARREQPRPADVSIPIAPSNANENSLIRQRMNTRRRRR